MRLPVRAPFHLEATVRLLQRRPGNVVDRWDGERYRRLLDVAGDLTLVDVCNRGSVKAPDVRLSLLHGVRSAPATASVAATVGRMLGAQLDPQPLHRCIAEQPRLRSAAQALLGMRPPRYPELFEAFANVIPFQQLSLDAGMAAVAGLVRRFGRRIEFEGCRYRAFPPAGVVARSRLPSLRACGLSLRKAHALRDIARAIDNGVVSERQLSAVRVEEALATLTSLPGIGPWSAALVLLRGLGRLDVFPPGDVGATSTLMSVMHLRSAASLERIAERSGDCRGYLYFCALASRLLSQHLIRSAPLPRHRRGPLASLQPGPSAAHRR